ncbi:MAG: NAD(+) synthase [Candidatus Latescibacteria bacterium]|nr:NAD(+) synthase [Candidatus Latescibacterota bacterium]NIM21503.1 NAD(+) synthase [Candidatus Latescibacterota bacterium]NIM65674.1 NAD(+) synthase [Candidatus Latescibacterota bacterium]NIO02056.1 NAD(+) synthase [Candidatus Latescibacterota bacterium]NIO28868.1 NAD(+) synthase [Candidatus Latescibacterota bacterium]
MRFSRDVMSIDADKISREIEEFIRDQLRKFFRKRGIVIGLSGGIDSAVAGALSVRAVGPTRVYGVLLPERDSSPKSREYGRKMAETLGIEYSAVEITPMLESFGVYARRDAVVKRYFPDAGGDYKFRLTLPQDLLDRDRINAYSLEVRKKDGSVVTARLSHGDYLEMMAANDIKQRTRMTVLYYEAERRNYIVCGTTNKSETDQGFFVKFGDGGVDIEPLTPLYKNQVLQLGKHLGVPEEILARTPSPDTYSFEVSDKDFYFCLPYDTVDMILYAQENSIDKKETAKALGLGMEELDRAWKDLERKREVTEHLRSMPPVPDLRR